MLWWSRNVKTSSSRKEAATAAHARDPSSLKEGSGKGDRGSQARICAGDRVYGTLCTPYLGSDYRGIREVRNSL